MKLKYYSIFPSKFTIPMYINSFPLMKQTLEIAILKHFHDLKAIVTKVFSFHYYKQRNT